MGQRQTVLVVEDDAAVRRFILVALRIHGYGTFEAADGESGLRAYLEHRNEIDLVLSDIVRPHLGPEMVEKILRINPLVPVGFVSETTEVFEGNGTLRHVPMLKKPFSARELIEFVRYCLDRGRAARRS